jgi:hypothetical protein
MTIQGFDVDTIASPNPGNAWSPNIGDTVKGVIVHASLQAPRDSFDKKKLEQSLRIDLDGDDGTVTVYVVVNNDVEGDGYAKRDARAVAAAVRAAGCQRLEIGGTLAVKRVEDAPTTYGSAARDFVAEYKPPAAAPVEPERVSDGGAVIGLI